MQCSLNVVQHTGGQMLCVHLASCNIDNTRDGLSSGTSSTMPIMDQVQSQQHHLHDSVLQLSDNCST